MLSKLFDVVFGCSHCHCSFPLTVRARRNPAASLTGTYVVCLDCGKEMAYDWKNMTVIVSAAQARHYRQSMLSKQAA
jgi:RNase P subunit RPR2